MCFVSLFYVFHFQISLSLSLSLCSTLFPLATPSRPLQPKDDKQKQPTSDQGSEPI